MIAYDDGGGPLPNDQEVGEAVTAMVADRVEFVKEPSARWSISQLNDVAEWT